MTTKENVLFWEDYSSKKIRESRIGRKALSLFKLKDMDVPVPEFFAISGTIFTDFCFRALDANVAKLLEKGRNPEGEDIEKALLNTEFEKEFEESLLKAYTRLSGFTEAWVSVRSSVIFPEQEEVSFSGIFSTELNVRGFDELQQSIKRIYASLFDDDVVAYASKKGIDLSDVKLGVVVQRMVQSEVSGVVFTVDPITQDKTKLSIESVYGLGNVISLGEITPDTYLLNKKDLSVVEKHIAPQEWMKVRTMRFGNKKKSNIEKIKISNAWSHRQKLHDKDMLEISKVALIVENKSGKAQNIEWVIYSGRLWVLQSKELFAPVQQTRVTVVSNDIARKNLREVVTAFLENHRSGKDIASQAMSEAKRIVEKNKRRPGLQNLINVAKNKSEDNGIISEVSHADFLISGIGASFGVIRGKVLVVDGSSNSKVNKEDILLIKNFSSEMESMIMSCGGVIMDTAGLTSDTAILCREFGIPAVLGTQKASKILKTGDHIYLDGNTGSIYRDPKFNKKKVDVEQGVHPVVQAYGDENLAGEEDVVEEEERVLIPKDSTLTPTATKVFSLTAKKASDMVKSVGNAHGIVYVDLDMLMLEDGRHIMAYVEDKKFVDYSKKICDRIIEYVDLAEGDEVIVSIGSSSVGEFRGLTKGKSFENSDLPDTTYGAARYVDNTKMLRRVIKIVKRVRNVYKKRNVSIALHSPMGPEMMREFKKQLSGEKLRRTSTFMVYAVLDNPAEVILADEILDAKIDGVILNMPRIGRQMQGLGINDVKSKYDLNRSSLFKVVDNVVESVKSLGKRTIVITEDAKALIKHSVEAGVYGVSVHPEDVIETRKLVADEEAKIILSK